MTPNPTGQPAATTDTLLETVAAGLHQRRQRHLNAELRADMEEFLRCASLGEKRLLIASLELWRTAHSQPLEVPKRTQPC